MRALVNCLQMDDDDDGCFHIVGEQIKSDIAAADNSTSEDSQ